MNRLGIRIGAGVVVICLGALAVLQTRSGGDPEETQWPNVEEIAAEQPPAPLGLGDDWPADDIAAAPADLSAAPPETLIRGNDPASAPVALAGGAGEAPGWPAPMRDGGVGLASYDQVADPSEEPSENPAASAFALPAPLEPEPAADPAAEASGFSVPATSMPADAAGEMGAGEVGASDADADEVDFAAAPDEYSYANPLEMSAEATSEIPNDDLASEDPDAAAALDPNHGPAIDLEDPSAGPATSAPSMTLAPVGSGVRSSVPAETDVEPAASDDVDMAASQWGQPPISNNQISGNATSGNPIRDAAPQSLRSEPSAPAPAPTAAPSMAVQAASEPAARIASAGPAPKISSSALSGGAVASATQLVDPVEVLAEPGERRLEGAQAPSVVIQKVAPAEVRVGKPADFTITVRNVGTVEALDVRVFDTVPAGASLVEAVPTADTVRDLLVWQLGDLKPGEERTVRMKLLPEAEGEIGSVARVTFEAAASVRTRATKPVLALEQRAPEQVLIGQQIEIEILVENSGSGSADNLVLQTDVPEGLEHPMGRQLDNLLGTMPPGDQRRQILRLRATEAGRVQNVVRLTGPDGVVTESVVDVDIVAPTLQVALDGPSMRYLERQTTFNVKVANTGTASASEVDLVAYLDSGLKFVSTDFEGQYDPNQHAVFWSLAELPAGQGGEVPLTLLPVEPGAQSVRLEARADLGAAAASEKQLNIETLAELAFSIADDQDPIETGTETVYEIRVRNTGSRDDSNVQLEVQLPHPAMELVSADPSAGTDGRGRVVFAPIATIPAKGEQVFHVRVRGLTSETHVIRATLNSDQSGKPVTKEESTTVYADE